MQRKTSASAHRRTRAQTREPSLTDVKLLVGLGNPGKEYEHTYHNAGALFATYVRRGSGAGKVTQAPLFTALRSENLWTVTTKTFMNESGRAVRAALAARKFRPDALLVAHDDSDIPLGEFKFAFGRGAAGHRGVASVIATLGTNRFWRLRIGVRHEPGKAGSFVLRQISSIHGETLVAVFAGAYRKLTENDTP